MLNSKKLLYILPDVAYVAELLPTKKEHQFSIQAFRQINGDFLDDNTFIAENVTKLIGKLEPEEYHLILPDFLFTNTIVEVKETSQSKVDAYLKDKLLPELKISKDTHTIDTFVLTQLKNTSKVQLSALEKEVMNPVAQAAADRGITITNISPLSWTTKAMISLEPSISVIQMGSQLYLAQHYIGIDQTTSWSIDEVEKIAETIKTLKGAEKSIQTLYLLTNELVEEKLKEHLSDTLPIQQLTKFSEKENDMPNFVKQVIETGMRTLDIDDFPVPTFSLEKIVPVKATMKKNPAKDKKKSEEELPTPTPPAEVEKPEEETPTAEETEEKAETDEASETEKTDEKDETSDSSETGTETEEEESKADETTSEEKEEETTDSEESSQSNNDEKETEESAETTENSPDDATDSSSQDEEEKSQEDNSVSAAAAGAATTATVASASEETSSDLTENKTETLADSDSSSSETEEKPTVDAADSEATDSNTTDDTETADSEKAEEKTETSTTSDTEVKEEVATETKESDVVDLTEEKPTSSDQKPMVKSEDKPKEIIKNKTNTGNMIKMIFITLAVLFATVAIGVGLGLGILKLSNRGGDNLDENPVVVTSPTPTPSPSATPEPEEEVDPSELSILVVNATTIAGKAGEVQSDLEGADFGTVKAGNAKGDYDAGQNYVLMEEENAALIKALEKATGLSLTFDDEISVEDAQSTYDAVVVFADEDSTASDDEEVTEETEQDTESEE